jgi:hypothetical protein
MTKKYKRSQKRRSQKRRNNKWRRSQKRKRRRSQRRSQRKRVRKGKMYVTKIQNIRYIEETYGLNVHELLPHYPNLDIDIVRQVLLRLYKDRIITSPDEFKEELQKILSSINQSRDSSTELDFPKFKIEQLNLPSPKSGISMALDEPQSEIRGKKDLSPALL